MKFERALDRAYGVRYRSVELFEEKFKDVVISKFKTMGEATSSK